MSLSDMEPENNTDVNMTEPHGSVVISAFREGTIYNLSMIVIELSVKY